jgi:Arc/MetJ family transcription regulator
MPIIRTSMRLDRKLLDEAVKVLGARSRSEAIDIALRRLLTGRSKSKIESPTPPA